MPQIQTFDPSPVQSQAGMLGRSLGTGLSKRLGLDEAGELMQQAKDKNDPVGLAMAVARLNMYSPEMGKALTPAFQQMLMQSMGQQTAQGLGDVTGISEGQDNRYPQPSYGGAGIGANPDTQNEISPTGIVPNSPDVPSNVNMQQRNIENKRFTPQDLKGNDQIASQYIMDMRPDMIPQNESWANIPTFNYQMKSDLRPEEEAQIRQDLMKKYSAQSTDNIVEKIRQGMKSQFNDYQTYHNLDRAKQKDIENKWNTFREVSGQRENEIIGGVPNNRVKTRKNLMDKYYQYARNLPVNLTPEDMLAQASALVQRDKRKLDAIEYGPDIPYVRSPKEMNDYLDNYKESAKDLNEMGYNEALREIFVKKKDLGNEEVHYVLNGDTTSKKAMKDVGDLVAPQPTLETKKGKGKPWEKGYEQPRQSLNINPNYKKQRNDYINKLSDRLSKISPEDDLVLLRGQALNSGATPKDFMEALGKAQEQGLKLSPFQMSHFQELNIPRHRPLWEIFNPSVYSKWFNSLRGKI